MLNNRWSIVLECIISWEGFEIKYNLVDSNNKRVKWETLAKEKERKWRYPLKYWVKYLISVRVLCKTYRLYSAIEG